MKTPADGWDRDEREALDELQDALSHPREPLLAQADEDRLLARIQREARGRGPVARGAWLRPVLAAAVVVLAVGAWFISRNLVPARPESPAPPEATIAATPSPTPYQLPLDKPDVTISLAAMTWRGSVGNNQLLADLKPALDAFRDSNYPVADREFAALEARYPDAVEVFLYGGVTRLFLNQPDRALAALSRAGDLADSTLIDRVNWYRAVAEQRAGRLAEARNRLEVLCRNGRNYAAQACRAIEQMP